MDGQPAVALWLGPGTEPDEEAIGEVLARTVDEDKHEELFTVLGQMAEAHLADAHWYLPWLAVDPGRQNEGLGTRLLANCLGVVDESGCRPSSRHRIRATSASTNFTASRS